MCMEDRYLELFKQLIRLKTTHDSDNMPEHDRCRELLKTEGDKRGLKTKIIPSHPYPSLLMGMDVDRLDTPLLLLGHLDVVQGREELFEPKIKNGRLFGRGASDMKFSIPVFFNVLDRLETGKEKILLAFTFDEEIGGKQGVHYLLDQVGLRPKVCFNPDGGDNFQIEAFEKGVIHFRVKTLGKAAHGSRPWLGENAIDKMLAIYSALRKEFPVIDSPVHWTATLSFNKMMAGDAVNKVPDLCEAFFDLRFIEDRTVTEIKELLTRIVGNKGEMALLAIGDNFYLDMAHWCSRWFQEAARRHLEHPMPIYRSEGASDARFFSKYQIPVIMSKPRCAGHHADDEWIDLKSLIPYTDILVDFAKRVVKEKD